MELGLKSHIDFRNVKQGVCLNIDEVLLLL